MSETRPQRPTTRALIGTMGLIAFLGIYVLLANVVAVRVLPTAGGFGEFLYYALAGLAWVPVAGLIIRWMYRR